MALTFNDLAQQSGGASGIPNDDLYQYLQENRINLTNEAKLGIDRIPASPLGREVRRRSKQDLFWLARYFTWETNPASDGGLKPISENLIDEEHYRVVCDLFVKKDDIKSILKQDAVKTRLLLWPRGGMKSTIDHEDTTQWILNFPEIRILYYTGEATLGCGFIDEVKAHFVIREDAPSLMNLFFPEYCVEERHMGPSDSFTCPLYAAKKTGRKEPTIYAASVGATKSGWHYELIKADDAVTDKNTESPEQCAAISKKLFLAEKLLVPGGYYIDYIGTRYDESDHYGAMLDQNIGDIESETGPGWVLTRNKSTGVHILIGKAIQIKPERARQLEADGKLATYQEAGEAGCILLLPHIMPYNWLMDVFAKDEKSFEGQLNQNPRPTSQVTFDRILLLKSTIPYQEMPTSGPVSQTWDFAFSRKKGRDYSTACSVMWGEDGQKNSVGHVQQIVRDRFNHVTLAKAIVEMAVKHRPFVIGVEDAAGSRFLEPTIIAEAIKTGDIHVIQVCSHIDWFSPDNQKDAKKVRMASLYPWLMEGRLKFWNGCMAPNLDVLYSEFEKCLTSHHHDDIPDVISQQPRYAPRAVQAIVENNQDMFSHIDVGWNLMYEEGCDPFGRVGFGPPTPFLTEEFEAEAEMYAETPGSLPPILGAGVFG